MKLQKAKAIPMRKQCVWCGALFSDKRPNTMTCGFACADARYQDKCRAARYQRRAPLLYLQALEREQSAKNLTWEAIDTAFGETFANIERGAP
jgi:hypothetical protein